MNKYFKKTVKVLAVVIVALLAVYKIFLAPQKVQVYEARNAPITAVAMGTGTLEAKTRAVISPKISGRIARINVDQGDSVKKGQVLFTLDDKDLIQQVDMAKADLAAANAGIDKALSQIKIYEATEKEAASFYNRISQLVSSGAVSADAFDKARQQKDVAIAQLDHAQLVKLEAERLAAKANASLLYHQERLADTVITAPFDALITKRYRDYGDIVVTGSKVFDIVSLELLWVSAWVDETMLSALKVGQSAEIVFRSEPQGVYHGKVARISPQADSETRQVLVDVAADKLPGLWAIGQRAEVYIQTNHSDSALVIPQKLLVWKQGQPGLYLVSNGKALWRKVSLGIEGKEDVEILDGVETADLIIIPQEKSPKQGRSVKVID